MPEETIHPSKWLVGPPAPLIKGISSAGIFARTCSITLLILMITWLQGYLGGFSLHPVVISSDPETNDTAKLFNWHPLLMTLAFAVFMTEAVLAYQAPVIPQLNRAGRKKMHWMLHMASVTALVLGVTAVVKSHTLKKPDPMPDLYSAHSYLGVTVLVVLTLQILLGVYAYLFPTIPLSDRVALGPLHRFCGMAVFLGGLAAMATGIQEKSTFIQVFGKPNVHSPILQIPGVMVIFIFFLAVFVLYHQVPPAKPQKESAEVPSESESLRRGYEHLSRNSAEV